MSIAERCQPFSMQPERGRVSAEHNGRDLESCSPGCGSGEICCACRLSAGRGLGKINTHEWLLAVCVASTMAMDHFGHQLSQQPAANEPVNIASN